MTSMDEYNFLPEKEKKQNIENFHQDGNLETIYRWLETIPFSKPPKTLARDFADGVLMAELFKIYYPRFLEVNNCIPSNNVNMRKDNWNTLNRKVFCKINFKLNNNTISQLANCHHGTIEELLLALHRTIFFNEDVNYLQESVQELESTDISETKMENLEEQRVESQKTESLRTNSENSTSELNITSNAFSSSLIKAKNNLKVFLIWLISILCFWKYFWKSRTENKNHSKEIVSNIYPHETAQETAYINAQINESVTRWAYEQLIEEIHDKEETIRNLNHKVAYLEGSMRQKDLKIAHLLTQVTLNSSSRQRLFINDQLKLRPKSHNPLMMPNSYGS